MKITHIFHSGFLVETKQQYFVFDYYKHDLPELKKNKPVYVFASHAHPDHYEPRVFQLLREQGADIKLAVLAKDIRENKYPQGIEVRKAGFDASYEIAEHLHIQTFHSTDAGVAYLVQCEEGTIFHAGDLHDWVWDGEPEQTNRQMTGSYRHEINKLKNVALDVAFIPLDPRQEKHYADGILYFLKTVSVKTVYPMHFWGKYSVVDRFLREYPQYEGIVKRTREIGLLH